jgi:hypothetical protein
LSGAWLSWNLWLMSRGEVYRLLVIEIIVQSQSPPLRM